MICLNICEDSTAKELEPIASAVHSLLGLPITIRSLNNPGIRMERGEVLDWEYTGPVLEEVLKTHTTIRKVPTEGTYKGKAVVVSPIKTLDGNVIGAIGVVDLVAALDILSVFREYPDIIDEVEAARKRKY
ncbi:DUF2111 domain-containing protein [Methanohalophilus sp.]|uniref:DUF2111 domain-containing protein n=1 Tax=Methanohalophilus sp. TaxID=1966352 RepID=UPI002633CDE8|nr:DUF2111 domain-containing protein [Methanohalophilus sp.]MDK2892051.1 hypothetical protein [Methanohalophilus sp.]